MPTSPEQIADLPSRRRGFLPWGTALGLGIAIVAVITVAILSMRGVKNDADTGDRVTHTMAVLENVENLLSRIKDAETGQRGYLLTGKETYLEPFTNAKNDLGGVISNLRKLVADAPEQLARLNNLDHFIDQKMTELTETVELRRAGRGEEAIARVQTDRGKLLMDQVRAQVAAIASAERESLARRQDEWKSSAADTARVVVVGLGAVLLLLGIGGLLLARDFRRQTTATWSEAGLANLSRRLQGDLRLDVLGRNALDFLAAYLDAQVGAIYIVDGEDQYRRVAAFALSDDDTKAEFRPRESLLGQAVASRRLLRIADVPPAYIDVNSGIGHIAPREILIAPVLAHDSMQAAVELGFVRATTPEQEKFLVRACDVLGMSVRSAKDRSRLEDVLEETQRQSEELQTQQEELRVSNEELEEQGRALRESRGQLEAQQAELEQTNSQLEEQTQLLEHQKDELSRASEVLVEKAIELELANKYKSEFLANMSHELRTPLNSTLILARLLADNKGGNLTAEQVKYAQTISSAGNDLLGLINDILDLSKIEAGKAEIAPEAVAVSGLVGELRDAFAPLAEQKGLKLVANIEPNAPGTIQSDGHRINQILKNLLSNALKFTERGEIQMQVYSRQPGSICFSVRDSGIGIPANQQSVIFEAFRQADGSTHRKYGGTGLGLSISRDLAHLLGGELAVASTAGSGSTFTLTLPITFTPSSERATPTLTLSTPPASTSRQNTISEARATIDSIAQPIPAASGGDDRDELTPQSRRILVVEDDPAFAAILRDLAHEQGFQCVIVHDGAAGIAAAIRYEPQAILLDLQLPNVSGLNILQELKRDPRTRHVPVHMISVSDVAEEALRLGAVGHALKPVNRDELVDALKKLESKFAPGVRRVLLVEDDDRQRASVRALLAALDVDIRDVSNSRQALELLTTLTFDCMVMDVNLPDMSGFDLLQRMSEQDDLAFPPVIIYTGRSLTADEEQKLRRFSRSIIIKDARSPERLLDEVTLFLHQVESRLPVETQRLLSATRSRDVTLEGRRVLLVEDDVRNIFALSNVLEQAGIRLEIARNGREALDRLEKLMSSPATAVDLILMDIMMPEMDGLTAMREIRKRSAWRRLPIIAITAKAMRDDQERALEAGANDYIAKPIDIEKLLSLSRVWISKS